ncbi:hypothetical protein BUE80_DR000254 [Diplocarpon rosae]|nr:hypothetical protein BUE80_DR000254 [Diplocarpon rosae]
MQILQIILILGFAVLSQAKSSDMFVSHAISVLDIKDFLIRDVIFTEVKDETSNTLNCTLSCLLALICEGRITFSDPNANTTTRCADGWYKNSTADRTPYSYVYCAAPVTDFSIWKFKNFTSPGEFELSLAHSFSDPIHFPPPYNYVEYFANVGISLQCSQGRGISECVSNGTMKAEITSISN